MKRIILVKTEGRFYYYNQNRDFVEGLDDTCLFEESFDELKDWISEDEYMQDTYANRYSIKSFAETEEENYLEEYFDKYEISSIDEFVPEFYYQNLTNGCAINRRAVANLLDIYSKEELIKIENYKEIGIVEYVADNRYIIVDNRIEVI